MSCLLYALSAVLKNSPVRNGPSLACFTAGYLTLLSGYSLIIDALNGRDSTSTGVPSSADLAKKRRKSGGVEGGRQEEGVISSGSY